MRNLRLRFARLRSEAADAGATTAEYAVLTLTGVAFAGVLFKVISSPKIQTELSGIIEKALS